MRAWHSMGQAAYLAGCIAMQWSNTITGFDKTTQRMDKDRYNSKWITSRDATASGNTQNFCYPFPRPKYLFLSVGTQFPENLRPASVATFALTQGGGYGGRPPLPHQHQPSASHQHPVAENYPFSERHLTLWAPCMHGTSEVHTFI